MYLGWKIACTVLMQTYIMAARAASEVASDYPCRCHMNHMRQPQASTSGMDQNAIRDSLKFEARFVAISETVIRMKKASAMPTNGKYQVTSSRHPPSSMT